VISKINDSEINLLLAASFRVGFYVTSGGLSDQPSRSGMEQVYLQAPLKDTVTDPYDKAIVFWHLGCQSGGVQSIYTVPVHFTPFVTYGFQVQNNFQVNPSSGPCVEQGNLMMVDALTYAPLTRMPFSPITFRLKANAYGADTRPLTVQLVSYDRNSNPIPQDNPPDPEHPEVLNVTLYYNPSESCHLSDPLEAVFYGKGMAASENSPLAQITFLSDTQCGVTNFSAPGVAATGASSRIIFTDSNYANEALFEQIVGRDGPDKIYLKLELAHSSTATVGSHYYLPYCLSEPTYATTCDQAASFEMDLISDSGTVAEYRFSAAPSLIWSDTQDNVLELSVFDTSDWEDGRELKDAIRGNTIDPPKNRGEAIYDMGFMNTLNCDLPGRPCDANPTGLVQHLEDTATTRIIANENSERPFLSEYFVKAGGLQVLQVYLGNRNASPNDKVWLQNQADIIYFSGHGFWNGDIALRYDQTYKVNPETLLAPNNDWDKDVDIVIFSACDQLSLCDDGNTVGFDPRCDVQYGATIGYDADHSPTILNCRQCSYPANEYGGQRWRALTRTVSTVVKGPKLYLGYYGTAPYLPGEAPNRDTQIVQSLLQYVGDFTDEDWGIEFWIDSWLSANIITVSANTGHPAAAIDAQDPNDMDYYALLYDYGLNIWYIPTPPAIYSSMANP